MAQVETLSFWVSEGDPSVLQSAVQTEPQLDLQDGDGAPDWKAVVGWLFSGGQSIEKMSKSLKQGGEGISGNSGSCGMGKGGSVGNGTGDQ